MLVWPSLCVLTPPLCIPFAFTLQVLAGDLTGQGSMLGLHGVRLEVPGS